MLRTRTDLFRVALLASIASTACGGKSETTDPNTNSATNSNTPNSNTAGNNTGGSNNSNPGSMTGTAGSTGNPPGNNTMPNVGMGGATLIADAGPGMPEGGASSTLDAGVVVTGCNSAAVILDGDVSTGLAQCDNGVIHRPLPTECPNNLPAPDAPICPGGGDVACLDTTECASNSDCTAQPYGHCTLPQGGEAPSYRCAYGCLSDSDCAANQVCICGAAIGTCRDATCNSDADCGNGLLCAGFYDRFGYGCGEPMQFACQTLTDECAIEENCEDGFACTAASGTRVCEAIPGVACGRPFVIDDVARLAPTIASRDFTTNLIELPLLDRLSQAEREVLADAWTEIARMEHASIAAFARFNLQLLSLGAPCALIEECNRAMADETLHARLAFSLASHYAARPIGPGRLPMDGALQATTLGEVLELVVVEGCIGETVAALEAAEALAHCRDEAVSEVLRQIHRDETRHAALAWRFVAWAVEQDASLVDVVTRTLAAHAISPTVNAGASPEPDTLVHGILTTAVRNQVRQAALRDVILPCVAALRASPPVASQTQHAV